MLPHKHFIYGAIFSLSLYFLFPELGLFAIAIIFLSSFLIDVDHYLFYIVAKKDLSLKNAHKWFVKQHFKFLKFSKKEKKDIRPFPCIFHGIEAIIILSILSFASPIFIYILIGFIFHEFLDLINMIMFGFPFYHIGSQTYNIINYTNRN